MTVGVFHVRHYDDQIYQACAQRLLASVRATMPGVPIVHFSDQKSPQIPGTDGIVRHPGAPIALMVARHFAAVDGSWLFLDTDVIVQRDVRGVFDDPYRWDLAVAERPGEDTESTELRRTMPFNCGVIFSRTPTGWADVVKVVEAQPLPLQRFMGLQQAVNDLIAAGTLRARRLPPAYNWSPQTPEEDVSMHAIVHYKGAGRKPWMLERGEA